MKRTTQRKKKKAWIVLLTILGLVTLGIGGAILLTEPGRQEIRKLTIAAVDFTKLQDGFYVGEYTGTKDHFRDTTVQVSVSSGKVMEIKVLKGSLDKQGKPVEMIGGLSLDDLSDRVILAQSLQVDVISGATLTSKVHLKAVEEALDQAIVK